MRAAARGGRAKLGSMRRIAAALLCCAVPAAAAASSGQDADRAPVTVPEAEVVGGRQAVVGRWDDAVGVYFEGTSWPSCTGTLIAPNVVLTAGHCIGGVSSVRLGVNDYQAQGGELIPVTEEIAYPDSQQSYDLGVLLLATPSVYATRIIATGCALDEFLSDGAPVAIVGWGATTTDGSGDTTQLMEATSTITDPDCTGGRGCNEAVSPGGELGAGGGGIDSCYGDSGGPLYLVTEDRGDFLVGVTSRGYDDSSTDCGEGGIYVRPDAVIEWIEETTGVALPRATCHAEPVVEPGDQVVRIEVEAGDTVEKSIDVEDPEGDTTFTLTMPTAPLHGTVTTEDDATVSYTAMEDYEGSDVFVVRVADQGVPPLSTDVRFEIAVVPPSGSCGCGAGGGSPVSGLVLLIVALLPLRRRRG
jgi:MYXO-CTERM domain-containing protein